MAVIIGIRLRGFRAVGTILFLLSSSASAQVAPGWTLSRVVDSTTPLPGAGGIVSRFAPYTAMTDGSGVYFSTVSGVYKWSEGMLAVVADTTTPLPGFEATMTEFGPPYADDGSVYFVAGGIVNGSARRGVYRAHQGVISVVASTNTAAPHGGNFIDFLHGLPNPQVRFQYLSAHAEQVAFAAVEADRTGMYLSTADGSVTTVADSVAPFSSTPITVRQFVWPSNENDDVAFASFSPGGIYAKINGDTFAFARNFQPAPGGGTFGNGLGTPEVHAGQVTFFAFVGSPGPGVYRWNGTGLDLVLNRFTSLPGETEPLSAIPGFAFNRGRVAIVGTGASGDALFAQLNGQMRRVFDSAQQLDGREIDSLYIETTGFERGTLAFSAFFTDSTIGIYTVRQTCGADWNLDGAVNSQDFFDFLSGFFTQNADFNEDDTTNSQDFFDFLAAFFAGC